MIVLRIKLILLYHWHWHMKKPMSMLHDWFPLLLLSRSLEVLMEVMMVHPWGSLFYLIALGSWGGFTLAGCQVSTKLLYHSLFSAGQRGRKCDWGGGEVGQDKGNLIKKSHLGADRNFIHPAWGQLLVSSHKSHPCSPPPTTKTSPQKARSLKICLFPKVRPVYSDLQRGI